MRYDFDQKIAKEHGVEEAIMFANISWWCHKNAAERSDRHFHDGHYWTWNSEEAWADLFGFWTIKQVSRILANLEKGGLLASGAFNRRGYDRTKWYRPTAPQYNELEAKSPNEPMQSPKRADANAQTGAPIPDIKAQIENTETHVAIATAETAVTFGDPLVNGILEAINEAHGSVDGTKQDGRRFAHLLAQKLRKGGVPPENVSDTIRTVIAAANETGNAYIIGQTTSPKSLYQNWAKIGVALKQKAKNAVLVVEAL